MLLKSKAPASLWTSPISTAFWGFAVLYLAALVYVRHVTYLDPGSWFFNRTLAYTRQYSEVRRQQADEYIRAATKSTFPVLSRNQSTSPDLCVGVAGLLKDPAQYLETSIGSLLEGLSGYERDRLHLSVYMTHRRWHESESEIPPHFKPWISKLADDVQQYWLHDDKHETHTVHESMSSGRPYYTDLMKLCYASGASYMAILEGETVAMDGWFHRTMEAIDQAEALSTDHDFKISLFYPEVHLPQWQPEATLRSFIISSTVVVAAFATALFVIRLSSSRLKPHLTMRVILTVSCICVPALIALAISAGRSIYRPLPIGLNRLETHHSNSQAYVFPRQLAKNIIEWNKDGHALGASEVVNGRENELVWTLNPSVIQHVGRKSLKTEYFALADKNDRATAEQLFNFAFELNDADELRKEHLKALGQEAEKI
ncbi:hypothetical protein PRZ48_013212 [Zasmidium cellare]|uniref:Integral membrane protein n=1 Tax=Zasmidium cellare TaxID=395010 RepID=A0ABR0E3P2_ZASCE|nr:hypothetical protein PRZ48_013212 [Zasmidium cellare]